MIVREALVPVLFGVGIGIAGALVPTRLVASLLFEVAPRDPFALFWPRRQCRLGYSAFAGTVFKLVP